MTIEWKEAANYLRKNRDQIRYSRTPIIDLGKRKNRKYRAYRRNREKRKAIQEYTDWNDDETFGNKPIIISKDHYRIVQIRRYGNTERKRRAAETKEG